MKKIYIIKSILKDWFTARLGVTLTVIGVFVLSFIAMFFVTTKVATEYLEDTETEKHYYNELMLDQDKVFDERAFTDFLYDDDFCSRWQAMDLPPILDSAYLNGWIKYDKINGEKREGTDFVDIGCEPVFSPEEKDRLEPVKNLQYYDYDIVEGRDITEEDLLQRRPVMVAHEGWAIKVGDKISCFGHELEVIGLNKVSPYSWRRIECALVPYWFLNECMKDPIDNDLAWSFQSDSAYRKKPVNNEYVLKNDSEHSHTPGQGAPDFNFYPGYVGLGFSTFMFEKRLDETQKAALADFLKITPGDFTNTYDRFYSLQVMEFNDRAFKECLIAAIFCILNVLMIVSFLSASNIKAYRTFRVYGCSRLWIFAINLICLAVIAALSLGISLLLCKPAAELFAYINSTYEFRQSCVDISVHIFAAVALIACIPAAIRAAMKSPVEN